MHIDNFIDTSSSALTAFIFVAIIIFVYVPLSIYHGYKYYKRRAHIIMQKRYSSIMIYEIIIIIFKMLTDAVRDLLKLYLPTSNYTYLATQVTASLLYKIMVCVWVWRFWCLHFDLNWTDIMLREEWKCIINKTTNTQNFYLSNKSTFGNKKWIFKVFILPLIMFTFLTTDILRLILSQFMYVDDKTINTIKLCSVPISIGPAILLTILYFKIPKFKDHFFIKDELKLLLISILMMYISYWSYYCFIQFGDHFITQSAYDEIIKYYHPTSTFAVVFFDFLCLMISTFLVNNKVKKIIATESYSVHNLLNAYECGINETRNRKKSSIDVPLIKIKLLPSNVTECNKNEPVVSPDFTLYRILRDAVDVFMEHLQFEISTENLLCWIELIQFQKYVSMNSNYCCNTERQLMYEDVTFSNSIPNSLIVFDSKDNIYEKANKLYNKYIRTNSEYQINIPHRDREKFTDWIENNNNHMGNLVVVLDNILLELLGLLNQSFYRFQQSVSYTTLCHQILRNEPMYT